MPPTQLPAQSPSRTNKRVLLAVVLPLASCTFSSLIGLILGQIGNQIYKLLGESAACLSIPGFLGLFTITFVISFFSNRLFRKWLSKPPA